jgi:glycosyltransferase involved in cell wall biosynthesis
VFVQAEALAARGHRVEVVGVLKRRQESALPLPRGVRVRHLVDETGRQLRASVGWSAKPSQLAVWHEESSALVPARWDATLTRLTDLAAAAELRDCRADVVVTTSPALLPLATQLLPSRVRIVHQEHRTSELRGASKEPLLLFGPQLDALVFLTEPTRQAFVTEFGDRAPRLEVRANALSPGYRPKTRDSLPLIVSAGRMTAEKQFDHLIRAFAGIADCCPTWRLRIFGDGPKLPALRRLVSDFGLNDRVELPGLTGDMPTEWAKASIMALSSRHEGLPLVIQEAMAAAVPVVSYDSPNGPRQLVEHGRTGLIVPVGDLEGLSAALGELARDPARRQAMGGAGLARSAEFDAAAIAASWEGLFDDVTAAPRRAHRSRVGRVTAASPEPATASQDRPTALVPEAAAVAELVHGSIVRAAGAVSANNAALLPRGAARHNLRLAWRLAVEASSRAFVIPQTERWLPVIALPASRRASFVAALRQEAVGNEALFAATVNAAGRRIRTGRVGDIGQLLNIDDPIALTVFVNWTTDGSGLNFGRGYGVDVQFWPEQDGALHAPLPNAYLSALPDAELATLTMTKILDEPVRTLPFMAQRASDAVDFPIDAVFTWVDDRDEAWQSARQARCAGWAGSKRHRESDSVARYRSRDELRFAMRSVCYFAPWVRNVYLVTAGQRPGWLAQDSCVRQIDHTEIFDARCLPTFNSHAIESRLHHIDGLSEHFVYFNDDCLLGRPVQPGLFFTPAGLSAAFLSTTKIGLPSTALTPHAAAAQNNRALLQRDFGRTITKAMLHTPHALRRSVLFELEKRYPDEFAQTAASPFRAASDLSVASSLYQHYALLTGRAVPGSITSAYVGLGRLDVEQRLGALRSRRFDAINIADFHEYRYPESTIDRWVREFFEHYYPLPCSLEVKP